MVEIFSCVKSKRVKYIKSWVVGMEGIIFIKYFLNIFFKFLYWVINKKINWKFVGRLVVLVLFFFIIGSGMMNIVL